MTADTLAVERFEEHRVHLRRVAYRMLGSLSEADDAVQEAWLRASAAGAAGVDNLGGWLTTIVARVCLNLLRSREARHEVYVPDPIVDPADGPDPEHEAVLADSVGLAMLVVLDSLTPAERLAFVLHDLFHVPFEQIAELVEKTPVATRQLASRARRRVHEQGLAPDPDVARQREVVDAFFAASREGDFAALVSLLDPEVLLRSDAGPSRPRLNLLLRGARDVASQAFTSRKLSPFVRPALINGAAGAVIATDERVLFIMAFTVSHGRIVAIDVLADPDRLSGLRIP